MNEGVWEKNKLQRKQELDLHNSEDHRRFRDAPFDIWGGELRVFVACKLFFTSGGEQAFFWRSTTDNFFLCFVEEIFCHMLSLLCTLPFGVFFWSTYFSSISTTNFFSAHIFNKLFFLTFVATNYFFHF